MLELLLANHPLDCPVCDKGGECPLQDQAFSHGPGESRYVESKRHYEKPIPISDLVYLDRERCILCDRCTRFADEVAGDKLIHFISRGNDTQVMTFPDEPFVSYFSGNTVQICPVGALTAKPYRFKARPWDLTQQESTCTTCSVGCRTVVQSSRDELLRYQGVDSDPVNWGWLCDRGRFNFEAVNSDFRLSAPMVKLETGLVETSWNTALRAAGFMISDAPPWAGPTASPCSVERVPARTRTPTRGRNSPTRSASPAGTPSSVTVSPSRSSASTGPPSTTPPTPRRSCSSARISRRNCRCSTFDCRDAAEKRRSRIVEFATFETGMTPYAWKSVRYEPGEQPDAVAKALADADIAAQIASGDVVVVVGRPNLAESAEATVAALQTLLAGRTRPPRCCRLCAAATSSAH